MTSRMAAMERGWRSTTMSAPACNSVVAVREALDDLTKGA